MIIKKDHESKLIKSILIFNDIIKSVYLVDGTKINLTWDEDNRPGLNIEKTPTYSSED